MAKRVLCGRFVVQRLIGMVAVLFAISIIVFLIFNVIPNSDPAARIAGKNADPDLIARVNVDLGLDQPLPVQYLTMMRQIFTGQLTSYAKQRNVVEQIWEGLPATFSLCIGAAVIWMSLAVLFGYLSAVHSGQFADRALTVALSGGYLDAGVLAGGHPAVLPELQGATVPDGQLCSADRGPAGLGVSPCAAVVHAGRAVHRLLQSGAALQHAGLDERGLCAHRPRQGSQRAPGSDATRVAQLHDSDRDAVRTGLRAWWSAVAPS